MMFPLKLSPEPNLKSRHAIPVFQAMTLSGKELRKEKSEEDSKTKNYDTI